MEGKAIKTRKYTEPTERIQQDYCLSFFPLTVFQIKIKQTFTTEWKW